MPRRTYVVEVAMTSKARPETVYDLVSDAEQWQHWAGPVVPKSGWARRGTPEPAGVGAIRQVGLWPVWIREETTAAEPGRRHEYVMRGSGPIRDYVGEVVLTPLDDGGTRLVWTVRFTELVPGTGRVLHAGVRQLIRTLSRRLARAAERA